MTYVRQLLHAVGRPLKLTRNLEQRAAVIRKQEAVQAHHEDRLLATLFHHTIHHGIDQLR